jgi:glycosyltransferase involved in cell wall biosynthesis
MRRPRILAISEIPTPYRLPLYRALAERPEIDFEVVFCAAEQPDRPWRLDTKLAGVPHRVLPSYSVRLRPRTSAFVYEVNPTIVPVLRERRPDVIVSGGYAVFAEQVALLYARATGTPYVLHSESHLLKPRRAIVRAAKRLVLPTLVGGAAAGLAAGSAAARYLAEYGLDAGRIRIFPNTIDVAEYGRRADEARRDAERIRAARGLPARFHLFAGRLLEVKGAHDLAAAVRAAGNASPDLVVAGEGPLDSELAGIEKMHLVGFQQQQELIELLALADATVVPSRSESWGVVVNEALACGCPVIVSDAVGAADDLVRDGVNGTVFPAGDVAALAAALCAPSPPGDPRSGRIARWDYDFAIEQFLEAMEIACSRQSRR